MPQRTIDDKSLLRCTIKKSADVFKRLVLYASYAVCGVTAFALAVCGAFALDSALANPVRATIDAVWNWTLPSQIFASIVCVLAAIPWYVYVGIAAVAAIFGYSYLWCIARELTEEDYQSEIANRVAGLVALVLGLVLGLEQDEGGEEMIAEEFKAAALWGLRR